MKSWSRFERGALVSALAFGLAASALLAWVLNTGSGPLGQKAIGSLVAKVRTTETRHNNQALWLDLPLSSPVFDLDTVRTDLASSAEVVLGPDSKVSLGPETMVRLDLGTQEGKASGLKVERGTARVQTNQTLSLVSGKASLVLHQGEVVLSASAAGLSATVVKGSADLSSAGTSVSLPAGTSQALDAGGASVPVTLAPLLPNPGSVVSTGQARASVHFVWTAPAGWKGKLVFSSTPDFSGTLLSSPVEGTSLDLSLALGTWYWALDDGTLRSEARTLVVRALPAATVLQPGEGEALTTTAGSLVDLRWLPAPGAHAYRVEVAQDPGFTGEVTKALSTQPALTLPVPGNGGRYLRIVALFEAPAQESASVIRTFQVTQAMETPLKWTDSRPQQYSLSRAGVAGRSGELHWSADGTSSYRVRVAEDEAMAKVVADTVLSGGDYRLPDSLAEGTYYVEVSRKAFSGTGQAKEAPATLIRRTVILTKPVPPVAVTPAEGTLASLSDRTLSLVYTDPNDSPAQTVEVATDPQFGKVIASAPGRLGRAEVQVPVDAPATLYWRVNVVDPKGEVMVTSSPTSFQVPVVLAGATILSPAPGSRVDLFTSDQVKFSWSPVPGATRYQLTVHRTIGGVPVKVRSWTSGDASVVWRDFNELTVDTYTVELMALKLGSEGVVLGQSPLARAAFRLEQSEKVKAVDLGASLSFTAP